MILVTGATGNAGSAVVRALTGIGVLVRALVRTEFDLVGWPRGVEPVVGDLNQPARLREHFGGVDAVFLLSGYANMAETLAGMSAAGVRRVVLLSSSAAPAGDMSNAVARYHILSEDTVRWSGLEWTFLQPNSFMSNALRWLPQLEEGDVVRAPFAGVPVAMIDPDDLGAVAAATLTSGGHEGRAYRLSGPEPLLPADQVAALGRALGRTLRFEPQPEAEAREEMSRSMPAEYVDAFLSFFADGTLDESIVTPAVEAITGRRPRSFDQWAWAHADAFQSSRRRAGVGSWTRG